MKLKMPLTRWAWWRGWPRSDRAPYGDCGTLGPFGCIELSLGEEQSGSMALENMWIMTHLWRSTSSLPLLGPLLVSRILCVLGYLSCIRKCDMVGKDSIEEQGAQVRHRGLYMPRRK